MEKKTKVRKTNTTVNEFFKWYSGEEQWEKDWQITNSMIIDNAHAQDDDYYGAKAIKGLLEYLHEEIEVEGRINGFDGTWDLEFVLKGKKYQIGSTAFFGETGY